MHSSYDTKIFIRGLVVIIHEYLSNSNNYTKKIIQLKEFYKGICHIH